MSFVRKILQLLNTDRTLYINYIKGEMNKPRHGSDTMKNVCIIVVTQEDWIVRVKPDETIPYSIFHLVHNTTLKRELKPEIYKKLEFLLKRRNCIVIDYPISTKNFIEYNTYCLIYDTIWQNKVENVSEVLILDKIKDKKNFNIFTDYIERGLGINYKLI